ncbi:MAG: hypothetical protein WC637_16335, partial [Victivallales bacterium]
MAGKPQNYKGYDSAQTELAERVLLDAWSRLGEYREHLVLIGGLVPQYLVQQPIDPALRNDAEFAHCGTMDVDLGINVGVANKEVYKEIRETLISDMGFQPGKNAVGREQKHSFVKNIDGVDVSIDFLTIAYEGSDESLMRQVQN